MLSVSASFLVSGSFARNRVSVPCISSSSSSLSTYLSVTTSRISVVCSVRSSLRRCPCRVYSSRSGETAELAEDKLLKDGTSVRRREAVRASEMGMEKAVCHSQSFLSARSKEELLSCIRKEVETGKLLSSVAAGMEELYHNYRNAVLQSENPKANEIILSNMAVLFDRILLDVEDPFTFSPHHKAVREPFDYYMFGQNYIRPLVDFRRSYVGNISLFSDLEEKLQQGHNIVLISNHQTEADPAVIALLLEYTNPQVAEKVTYIAGDRVLADPLCKPFSMGRNLLCVYSKKHMYDIPELAEVKKRANTRSLKEMALLLRTGGQIIWIAPSGGRDRPDPITGEWIPAPFDASSVDNIRRLAGHSSVPGHTYPLALLCHDIMPPPPQIEKHIGERRMISFHGVGLSMGPEMNFNEISAGSETSEEAKVTFSQALYDSITEQYNVLKSAINGYQGLNASNPTVYLSQPWMN